MWNFGKLVSFGMKFQCFRAFPMCEYFDLTFLLQIITEAWLKYVTIRANFIMYKMRTLWKDQSCTLI